MDKLIDFGDIQIFDGATTYPCLFIGRNATPKSQLSVSVLKVANSQDFNYNVVSTEEIFDFSQFSSDSWVITSKKEKILLNKLSKNNPMLKEIVGGEAYRGVLTGLTEAFLIDSNTYQQIVGQDKRAKEHIYPFLQGRHVSPYGKAEAVNYLILFEKGWTKCSYYEMNKNGASPLVSEEEAWNYVKSQYPSIASWLEPFAEKGRKRTDKGDYWWELRACDYYDQFAKPKIMYQKFQVKPCFLYEESSLFCNDSMWFIPENSNGACPIIKPLLAILNSRMGWWLITKHCTQIQNGYQLIWRYFGQIPVPELTKGQSPLLSQLADRMLTMNEQLQDKRGRFLRRLVDNLSKGASPLVKVTTTLQTFDQLDFKAFVAELKKQKIKLSLVQQDEWEEYFNQYKATCNELSDQITTTDNEIDQRVFDLYGLSEDEREIVMKGKV